MSNKIIFEIPKWAIGRHIYIFAGVELLGKKEVRVSHKNGRHVIEYLPLQMKPAHGRCTGCGSCCSSSGIPEFLITEILDRLKKYDGKQKFCPLLGDNGCIMKAWIPFSCIKSVCEDYEGCTEKLELIGDGRE